MGAQGHLEDVQGFVRIQLHSSLLQPHVQPHQQQGEPDHQLCHPAVPAHNGAQLPQPPPQCQVLQHHA